ncbi:MAG TPA: tyrosine-type recombinase/integrase [Candidatus Acidoferrum sp.]|nr:tyrosine-type recombinase/integrase [Candidatus Acidoferrum sp.]
MTDEQREKLLAASPAWLRFAIQLYADHGLRFTSALKVKPKDFNYETGILMVETKGGYQQAIPVTKTIRHYIETLPERASAEETIVEILAGKKITTDGVRKAFRRCRREAGIPEDVNPHNFRRAIATKAWKETKDIRVVQQILGHHSMHTTARYIVDEEPEKLRELLEELKPHSARVQ